MIQVKKKTRGNRHNFKDDKKYFSISEEDKSTNIFELLLKSSEFEDSEGFWSDYICRIDNSEKSNIKEIIEIKKYKKDRIKIRRLRERKEMNRMQYVLYLI